MSKFHGDFEQLSNAVETAGVQGNWTDGNNNSKSFRGKRGEILNWWEKSGSLVFQGKHKAEFEAKVLPKLGGEKLVEEKSQSAKIFLVHGHDRDARDQLELILLRLGLQPFILQNNDGGGNTIIEALEENIHENTAFGIILLTPDDFGYSKADGEADRQPRARQNVILEMGMVMASLGKSKMAILQKQALERPSDIDGILRISFNDHVREVVPKLAQSLQTAGFAIDGAKIAEASQ